MDTVEKILKDHASNVCPADLLQQRINALLEILAEKAEDARQRDLEIQSSLSESYWKDAEEAYANARRKLAWLTTAI